MRCIVDVEANGLDPTRIYCIVALDIDTGKIYPFDRVWEKPGNFIQFAKGISQWIGHNFFQYDRRVLKKLLDIDILPQNVLDTLVVSRMIDFHIPGGHGLEAWGVRLGIAKPVIQQWDYYEPIMLTRCIEDCKINFAFYQKFEKYITSPRWALAMKIEHSTQEFCCRLHENGFPFDIRRATTLLNWWERRLRNILNAFQKDFPPRYRLIKEIYPVLTKTGKLHSKDFRWAKPEEMGWYSAGAPFSLVEPVPFDPASKQQIIVRLWEAGWKPWNKTEGHKDYLRKRKADRDPERMAHFQKFGWKVDELNLQTLPKDAPPSVHKLVEYLTLTGKLNQLRGWITLYNEETKAIHGTFNGIGAWSGRCSHAAPNMANASSDHVIRSLWTKGEHPDVVLVGCDASGIQLRILGHYMEDERFIKAVCEGSSKDGTDPHTMNQKALGEVCKTRHDAKTFNFGCL